jgi:hypothetical protein
LTTKGALPKQKVVSFIASHGSCPPHSFVVSKKLRSSITLISKGLRKERSLQKRKVESFSPEVEGWPKNGFQDLRKILKRSLSLLLLSLLISFSLRAEPGIKKLCRQVRDGSILSPNAYQLFMDYVVSHLYVANPQARIGAIQTMTMEAYDVLKSKGMVPCTNFKTSETYSFQYISACEASMRLVSLSSPPLISNRLLDIYVTEFRSRVLSSESEQKFVFLSAQGSKMTNLGRWISSASPHTNSHSC